jgi:hypothetical protein
LFTLICTSIVTPSIERVFAAVRRLAAYCKWSYSWKFGYASLSIGLDIFRKALGKHGIATLHATAIDALFAIEREINGAAPQERVHARVRANLFRP